MRREDTTVIRSLCICDCQVDGGVIVIIFHRYRVCVGLCAMQPINAHLAAKTQNTENYLRQDIAGMLLLLVLRSLSVTCQCLSLSSISLFPLDRQKMRGVFSDTRKSPNATGKCVCAAHSVQEHAMLLLINRPTSDDQWKCTIFVLSPVDKASFCFDSTSIGPFDTSSHCSFL